MVLMFFHNDFPHATVEEINKIIKDNNSHLTNIVNNDVNNNRFSENAKTASVWPIFKKKDT